MRPTLTIENARLIGESMANDVVIVNDAWVFRFAKTDWSRAALAAEVRVLELICGRLPLTVPEPVVCEPDAIAYRLIEGEPLTRWAFATLDDDTQQRVVDQLGAFLRALHAIGPIDGLPVVTPECRRVRYVERRTSIEQTLMPHLMKHQVNYLRQLFDEALDDPTFFDYTPCLVNDDLAPYHILFDAYQRKLSGIIDFGTAHFGDPACDFGCLMQHFGEGFVSRLFATYPEAQMLLPRARFYALVIEFDWVAQGIQHNNPFLLTAHLGNTRDVRFPVHLTFDRAVALPGAKTLPK